MSTPLTLYQSALAAGKIKPNPQQQQVVLALEALFQEILQQNSLFIKHRKKLMRHLGFSLSSVKGIYLWGEVGRGKTFLMDLFFHALPLAKKKRFHFHRFMQRVHHALHQRKGTADPLKQVARDLALEMEVLCFDEFYVEDIADAMILGELFQYLVKEGVILVLTSNTLPKNLYENGLQRDKFLPAIALIEAHTQVLSLSHPEDYRTQFFQRHKLYHYPLDDAAASQMALAFEQFGGEHVVQQKELIVLKRPITMLKCGNNIAWFTFEALCMTARSASDYIEIARNFRVVLLSNVKKMDTDSEPYARRFIALVDECYDRHVTLILSAEVTLHALYHGRRYIKEFQRTLSRLTEMQSAEYLAKPHLG